MNDLAGNTIASVTTVPVKTWKLVPGYLTFQTYDAGGGNAVSILTSAARQELGGESIDWGHAASAAMWQQAPTINDGDAIERVINAGSAGTLPLVAFTAKMQFNRAAEAGTPAQKTAAVNAIAGTLSAAALKAQ